MIAKLPPKKNHPNIQTETKAKQKQIITKIPLLKPYLTQMPQSKPYNQHNKKQRKQKGKGNINERHFNLKKKTQNTLESKQKAKGYIRQGKTYKERALPHQLTMQLK